jgi:hypothetical protein
MEHLRFPNESAEYRAARNALLEEEMALRAQIEAVAAKRRALPLGGEVAEDYVFECIGRSSMPERVKMSELFGTHDTLVLYSFMYGTDREWPCPGCHDRPRRGGQPGFRGGLVFRDRASGRKIEYPALLSARGEKLQPEESLCSSASLTPSSWNTSLLCSPWKAGVPYVVSKLKSNRKPAREITGVVVHFCKRKYVRHYCQNIRSAVVNLIATGFGVSNPGWVRRRGPSNRARSGRFVGRLPLPLSKCLLATNRDSECISAVYVHNVLPIEDYEPFGVGRAGRRSKSEIPCGLV